MDKAYELQQDDAGQAYVYVADEDDRLALRPVAPGPVIGDQILVTQGLSVGDRVLLSTPRPAVPGLALDVIDAGGADQ